MTAIGKYHVARLDDGPEWAVVYQRPDAPEWLQTVARFIDPDRAASYAELENDMAADLGITDADVKQPVPSRAAPETVSIAGILRKIEAALGNVQQCTTPPAVRSKPTVGDPPAGKTRAAGKPVTQPQRRFTEVAPMDPENVRSLPADNPALTEGRTLFPSTVVDPLTVERVLVSGKNNRKLGDRIVKGPWAGMPLFHLTLEERATCPDTCYLWATCYGNGMQMARRHKAGPELESALIENLAELQKKHPGGFVVRLHTLGDFYSVEYVEFWRSALAEFPALRCYGYTARTSDSDIGRAVYDLAATDWDRFAIRFSTEEPGIQGSTTIFRKPEGPVVDEGIVCPAETGATACCGTCGLCWHPAAMDKCIVFVAHGPKGRGKGAEKPEKAEKADKPPKAPTRVEQVMGWLEAQGSNPVTIPTKNALAKLTGVPKGSLGYIWDQIDTKGLVARIVDTDSNEVEIWLHGPEKRIAPVIKLPVSTKKEAPKPQKPAVIAPATKQASDVPETQAHSPRGESKAPKAKFPTDAEKEEWVRKHGVTTEDTESEVNQAARYLRNHAGGARCEKGKHGWHIGWRRVTEAEVIAAAKEVGFGQKGKKKRKTQAAPPALAPVAPRDAVCVRPGCKGPAQPGRDICATCISVEAASKPRERANMTDYRVDE